MGFMSRKNTVKGLQIIIVGCLCLWTENHIFLLYTIPCAFIASATFKKPAILAPVTVEGRTRYNDHR